MLAVPNKEAFKLVSDANNGRAEALKRINARAQILGAELNDAARVGAHHPGISKQLRAEASDSAPAGMLMASLRVRSESPTVNHTAKNNRVARASSKRAFDATLNMNGPKH